jgi:hypothetical protein
MQLMNNILVFLVGFLTCSVTWRIDQGKHDDIIFPAVILATTLALLALRKLR